METLYPPHESLLVLQLAERVHAMFGTKENEDIEVFSGEVPSKECIEEAELNGSLITQCIRRELIAYQRSFLYQRRQTYLRSLLSQSTINAIDVSQLERPAAVLSALRLEYSAKQGITFDEVVCVGRLSDPLDSENKYIKFLGCVLLGCRYDENVDQISELTSEDVHQKLKGVWIRADRRTNVPDERVAITLHDRGTLDAIMEVRVSSTIPATHWMLRGARILTFTPT
ncbi:hypothetical protein Tcan_04392 [Toxocara canis]|uniref:Dynein heavy chain C-terminal domain-containing protein n=1 Tax=Toxocara canis TaxID=6265 RepID=A0A0B2UY22_TOXCA|nr:hypothetical protein Tcan_04392 [Toxocara canis]